jgi:chemotaxis signal transduction protein
VDNPFPLADCSSQSLIADEDLQSNLVRALHRLQNRELDAVFLDKPSGQQSVAQPYFSFAMNGEQFVVNARYFCEVFTDIPIAPLPNAPSILSGLANLRGLLLPVYQLHQYLQVPGYYPTSAQKPAARKSVVLVIGKGESAVGLVIDALPVSLSLALAADGNQATEVFPHPQLPGLAQVHVLPDKTLAQLQVEQLPQRLLNMASEPWPHTQ